MSSSKLLLLLTIFIALPAFACDITKWKLEGKPVDICFNKSTDAYTSSACAKGDCGANQLLKRAASLELKSYYAKQVAPANPGEVICRELEGQVMLGVNDKGSENGFCQAKDSTLIDLSSLARAQSKKSQPKATR